MSKGRCYVLRAHEKAFHEMTGTNFKPEPCVRPYLVSSTLTVSSFKHALNDVKS